MSTASPLRSRRRLDVAVAIAGTAIVVRVLITAVALRDRIGMPSRARWVYRGVHRGTVVSRGGRGGRGVMPAHGGAAAGREHRHQGSPAAERGRLRVMMVLPGVSDVSGGRRAYIPSHGRLPGRVRRGC